MQRGEQQFFKDRSVYYATFPIREQVPKDEWDYELKGVYVIDILNFIFQNQELDYFHHQVRLVDLYTKEVFYDKLTFIYLEIPKFNKKESELETMFDKWMFVLCNLASLLERPVALQKRIFSRLFDAAEIAAFSPQRRNEYWESLKNYRDWKNVLDTNMRKSYIKGYELGHAEGLAEGRAEGHKEGLAEGFVKGREEAVLVTARRMKQKGIPVEDIAEVTGLTLDTIKQLQ